MPCKVNFVLFLMTLLIDDGAFISMVSKDLRVKTKEADRQLRDVAAESCNKAFPKRKNDLNRDGLKYGNHKMTYGGYSHLVFSCDIECKYKRDSGSWITSFPEDEKCDISGTRCKMYTEEKNTFGQPRRMCLSEDFTLQLAYSLIKSCKKPEVKNQEWEIVTADLTVNNRCRITCLNVDKKLVVLPRIAYRKPGTLCGINSICRRNGKMRLDEAETVCKSYKDIKMDPEAKEVCQGLLKYLSSEGRVHKELEGHSNFVIEKAEASTENECAVHCYMSNDYGPLKNVTTFKNDTDCGYFMKCKKTGEKSPFGIPVRKCQKYFLPNRREVYQLDRVMGCLKTYGPDGVLKTATNHSSNNCQTNCIYHKEGGGNYTEWAYLKAEAKCTNGTHIGRCYHKKIERTRGKVVRVTQCQILREGVASFLVDTISKIAKPFNYH